MQVKNGYEYTLSGYCKLDKEEKEANKINKVTDYTKVN